MKIYIQRFSECSVNNVLSYLFDNPFSVFRIKKTTLMPESKLLIRTTFFNLAEKK